MGLVKIDLWGMLKRGMSVRVFVLLECLDKGEGVFRVDWGKENIVFERLRKKGYDEECVILKMVNVREGKRVWVRFGEVVDGVLVKGKYIVLRGRGKESLIRVFRKIEEEVRLGEGLVKEDLENMKKGDLKVVCKSYGIIGLNKMSKEDMLNKVLSVEYM